VNILISGVTGFVGSHLADFLLTENSLNHIVIGTKRHRSNIENIKHINNSNFYLVDGVDICSITSIIKVLQQFQPELIFHLAAQSFVQQSWEAYQETINNNVIGTYNLLYAIRNVYDKNNYPRILIAGSSEEYGNNKESDNLTEGSLPFPSSPYGISKLACTLGGIECFKAYGIPVISTRAFNHTGARRGDSFMISNFCKQVVMMERAKYNEKINNKEGIKDRVLIHGDITTYRDYTDVGDMIRAYWLAINVCYPGQIYNISSGNCYNGTQIIETIRKYTDVNFTLKVDTDRLRPSDISMLHSNANKFKNLTGWKAEFSIENTIKNILNYWRNTL